MNKTAKVFLTIAMIMFCANFTYAFSPFEAAVGTGIFFGMCDVFFALLCILGCGLLIKAFGVFGYIFSLVLVFMSIYL